MINILGKIPRQVVLACSGGVDSMAALDFLRRNHKVTVHFVHHNTKTSDIANYFLRDYCKENNIAFLSTRIFAHKAQRQSQEEFWREERYKYFFAWKNVPVVTCHHLNDAVETWVWSSLNGCGKIIPYRNNNVIRPFLTTTKKSLEDWCLRHDVPWVEDESNLDTSYTRNYIRHELMSGILKVNPGIEKTIRKKYEQP